MAICLNNTNRQHLRRCVYNSYSEVKEMSLTVLILKMFLVTVLS